MTALASSALPVAPSASVLQPLPLSAVRIDSGFWGDRQDLNARVILDHCEHWMEKVGWIGNFDAAVQGRLPEARQGREFSDSDVYKLLEAMAWEVGRSGDEDIDRRLRAIVARILPVQEEDGYLNTMFGRPGQAPRYSDLEWGHELYCYGHLLQAAVARGRTVGEDELVMIARRAADHVCDAFGKDGIDSVDGHPEIEMALVEFARYTGEQRYLEQARLFVERRGHGRLADIELGRSYFQDDEPVRDSTVFRGHAVRALYLAAGAVDLATETDDDDLTESVRAALDRTVARRTYLTGGMGAHHEGESFGGDYELPSDRAYSETCAGVASVMLNHRLLLATGDPKHADLIERTLFNVVATSPAEDGRAFYYTNTLHQREPGTVPAEDVASPRASSSLRAPWFNVSCCPTNVARTLASLGAYLATRTENGLQLHQYASATISVGLQAGDVSVRLRTDYPDDGTVRIEVLETPREEWTLSLRVPAWAASGATVQVAGEERSVDPGQVDLTRVFRAGEEIVLSLPVQARWTNPHPKVDALRAQSAVERGPLVMCLESTDLAGGGSVDEVRITGELHDDGSGVSIDVHRVRTEDDAWPYGPAEAAEVSGEVERVRLIPYHAWANRGPSTMRVWLPHENDVEPAAANRG
jgi:DUF1680 family protein